MRLKKNNYFIILIFISLIFIHSSVSPQKLKFLNDDCHANLTIRDRSSQFYLNAIVFLKLNENNTGYFDISGNIESNGANYTIARSWGFNYAISNNDTLHLTKFTMDKRAADNSADNLINEKVFNTYPDKGRYYKIGAMNNAWEIGNLYSPLYFCILKNK